MALNLNKSGDEPKKFNLAKSDPAPIPPANDNTNDSKPEKEKKSKVWLLVLLLLGAGLGIWYFTSTNATSKTEPETIVSNADVTNAVTTNPVSDNPATTAPSTSTNETSNTNENPTNTGTENTHSVSENSANKLSNNSPTGNNTSNNSEDTKAVTNKNGNEKKQIKVVAYFNAGSSNISSHEDGEVKDIVSYLKKNPTGSITINGYASSEGDPAVNQQLSQKRAEAFKQLLIGKGVLSDRIETSGKGAQDPIASNETSDGRAKNRRVEVVQ